MNMKEITENVLNLNTLASLCADTFTEHIEDAIENADKETLIAVMGAQASYLHNMGAFLLTHADVKGIDKKKLDLLVEKMSNIAEGCAHEMGIHNIRYKPGEGFVDEDEDDDDTPTEEDVDNFAKDAKLNKTETAVLKKIVLAKGNPDLTEKEQAIALKMAPKIENMDI